MKYDETDVAKRYDQARRLSSSTMNLWLNAIGRYIKAEEEIDTILDLGCGTGRFSTALATRFGASVVGLELSRTMLGQAIANSPSASVRFCRGDAQSIPFEDSSISMIFLSMVYHHIDKIEVAMCEFRRVLRPGGLLCIRNSTTDLVHHLRYLKYFPTARRISQDRLPSQLEIITAAKHRGLKKLGHDIIDHEFAASPEEYVDKIARRGLSDLLEISDTEFRAGLEQLREASACEIGTVTEQLDLFVFQKQQ